MTKYYLFYIELDGPICGIKQGSIELDTNPSVDAWEGVLDEMAHDHVSSYIDVDEYEEENGCEIEVHGTAEAYKPEKHNCEINGLSAHKEILENMKQDEEGRWYVEK
tara:strand:- start:7003 stop:7323 length:321 start_codon:yes stop_codon:yes gene_type:complete